MKIAARETFSFVSKEFHVMVSLGLEPWWLHESLLKVQLFLGKDFGFLCNVDLLAHCLEFHRVENDTNNFKENVVILLLPIMK